MKLSHLRRLTIAHVRCKGEHLNVFLRNHRSVQTLRLENIDVTGSIAFADTLESLQHPDHHLLQDFTFRQIAQNSRRLYLHSLGKIYQESSPTNRFSRVKQEADFFDDFVDVRGPFKYSGDAQSWEGIQDKIGLLKEDLRVSHKSYESEHDYGYYHWME